MKRAKFHNKQQGATLVTALVLLVVMTIIGVTATKMSSIETLIAGNDQSKMKLFQETQSDLYTLTTPLKLMPALLDDTLFVNDTYVVSNSDDITNGHSKKEYIKKLGGYICKGIDGLAASVGGPCKLYDFKVTTRSEAGGAREESHRGAGKEVPPVSPNCLICQ